AGAAAPCGMAPPPVALGSEAGRDLVAGDVQPLPRDVDVDAAFSVGDREPGLRAQEGLVLDAELVDARDGDLGLRIRVAVADHDRAHDVRTGVIAEAVARRRPAVV